MWRVGDEIPQRVHRDQYETAIVVWYNDSTEVVTVLYRKEGSRMPYTLDMDEDQLTAQVYPKCKRVLRRKVDVADCPREGMQE